LTLLNLALLGLTLLRLALLRLAWLVLLTLLRLAWLLLGVGFGATVVAAVIMFRWPLPNVCTGVGEVKPTAKSGSR